MRCKLIVTIIDGFGIDKDNINNTIRKANPKFFYYLCSKFPYLELEASGARVGLEQNQAGNSEVGHITIGAGRKMILGNALINNNLKNISNKLSTYLKSASKNKIKIHLLGMPSSGLIHSSTNHLFFLIEECNKYKIKPILHLISDGRDCHKKDEFMDVLKKINETYVSKNKAFIGTISGRYFSMDRNENWNLTIKHFDQMVKIQNDDVDPVKYVQTNYDKNVFDEFIEPKSFNNPETIIHDKDIFICFNFRSDRMRQICHLIKKSNAFRYDHDTIFDTTLITFTDYKLSSTDCVCVPLQDINDYLGKIISDNGLSQLRVAETEKYAHITYYLDCMHMDRVNNCDSVLIPSHRVLRYDLVPKMNANFVTNEILNSLDLYDVIFVNYANTDMMGHTGNEKAAIKAIKYIDNQLKKLYKKAYIDFEIPIIITSDHGNVEKIIDENGIIYTSHTTNKVPFIFINNKVELDSIDGDLTNVASTILDFLGISIPKSMNKSLIK